MSPESSDAPPIHLRRCRQSCNDCRPGQEHRCGINHWVIIIVVVDRIYCAYNNNNNNNNMYRQARKIRVLCMCAAVIHTLISPTCPHTPTHSLAHLYKPLSTIKHVVHRAVRKICIFPVRVNNIIIYAVHSTTLVILYRVIFFLYVSIYRSYLLCFWNIRIGTYLPIYLFFTFE